jgi:hypothetical protein
VFVWEFIWFFDGGFVWLYFVKKGMDSLDAMYGI